MNKKIIKIVVLIAIVILLIASVFWYTQSLPNNSKSKNTTNNSEINRSKNDIILDVENTWSNEVNNNFLSGKWSKEEFILNNLAYIIDNKGKTLATEKAVNNISQTLLVSNIYLQNGKDSSVKNKIKEFHKIIYPYAEDLKKIRKPAKKIGFFDSIAVMAQDEDDFDVVNFDAAGFDNYIYALRELRINPEFIDLVKTATIDSYIKYNELGYSLKPVQVTIHLDTYTVRRGIEDSGVEASTRLIRDIEEGDFCDLNIWGDLYNAFRTATSDSQKNEIKQTIAHEMYHCVQDINFPDSFAAYSPFNYWYMEGSAEYFSNVVYPFVDQENERNAEFDRLSLNNEIYKISDSAYIFHQYLANKIGNDGLKNFYQTMPAAETWTAQRTVLSNLDNIEELFHDFAKSYIDGTIMDTSGSLKVFSPRFAPAITITETTQKTFRTTPFLLHRNRQEFIHNNGKFDLTVNSETGITGKYSTKLTDSPEWKPYPPSIPLAASAPTVDEGSEPYCSSRNTKTNLKFIQTTTVNTEGENIQILDINATDTGSTQANSNIDRDITGNWRVDENALRRIGESLMERIGSTDASVNITNFRHNGNLCFKADGTFFSDFASNVDYTTVFGRGGQIESSLVLFGTVGGNYTTQDNTVSFTGLTYNNYGKITTAGITFPIGNKIELPEKIAAVNQAFDLINPRNNEEAKAVNRAKIKLKEIISTLPQSEPPVDYSTPYQRSGDTLTMKFPILGNPDMVLTRTVN